MSIRELRELLVLGSIPTAGTRGALLVGRSPRVHIRAVSQHLGDRLFNRSAVLQVESLAHAEGKVHHSLTGVECRVQGVV